MAETGPELDISWTRSPEETSITVGLGEAKVTLVHPPNMRAASDMTYLVNILPAALIQIQNLIEEKEAGSDGEH